MKIVKIQGYKKLSNLLINNNKEGLSRDELREGLQFVDDYKKELGKDAVIIGKEKEEFEGYPEYGGVKGTLINYIVQSKKD